MRIYSNSFFHYTKDLNSLKGILQNGFKVHFCKEAIYSADGKTSYAGIPMVCFCDIPLSHISEIKYAQSKIGIGMKRTWGIQHKLQPVFYYPNSKECHSTRMVIEANRSFNEDKSNIHAFGFLGISKPLYDLSLSKECNYIDREWRKIYESRNQYQWKTHIECDEFFMTGKHSQKHVGSPLKFDINDIECIIVGEHHIIGVHDFITHLSRIGGKELKTVSQTDKELLLSKIISFETLVHNI